MTHRAYRSKYKIGMAQGCQWWCWQGWRWQRPSVLSGCLAVWWWLSLARWSISATNAKAPGGTTTLPPPLPSPLGESELMMMRRCWWWWQCHYITGWEVKTSMMMRQKDWHTGVPHEYLGTLIESWIQKAQMSDNENFRSPLESERA